MYEAGSSSSLRVFSTPRAKAALPSVFAPLAWQHGGWAVCGSFSSLDVGDGPDILVVLGHLGKEEHGPCQKWSSSMNTLSEI